MSLPIRAGAEASYNGYTFSEHCETTGVSSRPVPDAAGRTVAYVSHTVTLKDTLTAAAGVGTDAAALTVRRQLEAYGGAFKYLNKGFGGLSINVAGGSGGGAGGGGTIINNMVGPRDVNWGPKPQILSWKPLGDNLAWEFTWSVEVCVPECGSAAYQFALMELVYRLSFSVDRAGYTTRTYSGHLKIPQTRAAGGSRRLTDTADAYLERIVPQCPPEFTRARKDRELSEDKCKLSFTFVDEQNPPQALPAGVISCKAGHTTQNSEPMNLIRWSGTISASYELERSQFKGRAFGHFLDLVRARLDEIGRDCTVIPTNFSAADPDIYGRAAANFAFSFTALPKSRSATNVLQLGGLWSRVPGSDTLWRASLAATAFAARGNAGLRHLPRDDAIIDLCLPASAPPGGGLYTATLSAGGVSGGLLLPAPPPENSYLLYECRVAVEPANGPVVHIPLERRPPGAAPGATLTAAGRGLAPQIASGPAEFFDALFGSTAAPSPAALGADTRATIQTRAGTGWVIRLTGRALRAGYEVPVPEMVEFGGVPVVTANRADRGERFEGWLAANNGLPIYAARWNLRYVLSRRPSSAPAAPNASMTNRRRQFRTPSAPVYVN